MLELLVFLGAGWPGHDFDQGRPGLNIQQPANHKAARDGIPDQFPGAIGTLGEPVGVNVVADQLRRL